MKRWTHPDLLIRWNGVCRKETFFFSSFFALINVHERIRKLWLLTSAVIPEVYVTLAVGNIRRLEAILVFEFHVQIRVGLQRHQAQRAWEQQSYYPVQSHYHEVSQRDSVFPPALLSRFPSLFVADTIEQI